MASCLVIIDADKRFLNVYMGKVIEKINALSSYGDFGHVFAVLRSQNGVESDSAVESVTAEDTYRHGFPSCATSEFLAALKKAEADELYVCGIDIEGSLVKSIADLEKAGYYCHVVDDCCASAAGTSRETLMETLLSVTEKEHFISSAKTVFKEKLNDMVAAVSAAADVSPAEILNGAKIRSGKLVISTGTDTFAIVNADAEWLLTAGKITEAEAEKAFDDGQRRVLIR